MELYRAFPKLTTLWCCVEIMLYPGQLYGWSSLLYILKREGFYQNLCEQNNTPVNASKHLLDSNKIEENNVYPASKFMDIHEAGEGFQEGLNGDLTPSSLSKNTVTKRTNNESIVHRNQVAMYDNEPFRFDFIKRGNDTAHYHKRSSDSSAETVDCFAQDASLNLWFSVAVAFSYVMCAILGPLIRKTGLRFFRLFFILVYVIGALCIGFATKDTPWLLCPGLCFLGISGMALYATSIQVSFLFPAVQSTITAFLVGIFDVSTIIMQLVKIAFENGISRRISFIVLAVFHVVFIGTSTCFLLPVKRIDPFAVRDNKRKSVEPNQQEKHFSHTEQKEVRESTLRQMVCSSFFILHIHWMSVKCLRFVTYIGFLNMWIASLYHDNNEKESHFLSAFAYITLGTVLVGPTAGLLHDYHRQKYFGEAEFRKTKMPMMIPFLVTTIISVACTSVALVKHDGGTYVSFILFTFYRVYVYSYEITYISDAFPLVHFTMLYGILQSVVGIAGFLQYALFGWYEAYEGAPFHVSVLLIVLELSTLSHPANIWYKCRKHPRDLMGLEQPRKSIHYDLVLHKDPDVTNDVAVTNDPVISVTIEMNAGINATNDSVTI